MNKWWNQEDIEAACPPWLTTSKNSLRAENLVFSLSHIFDKKVYLILDRTMYRPIWYENYFFSGEYCIMSLTESPLIPMEVLFPTDKLFR